MPADSLTLVNSVTGCKDKHVFCIASITFTPSRCTLSISPKCTLVLAMPATTSDVGKVCPRARGLIGTAYPSFMPSHGKVLMSMNCTSSVAMGMPAMPR